MMTWAAQQSKAQHSTAQQGVLVPRAKATGGGGAQGQITSTTKTLYNSRSSPAGHGTTGQRQHLTAQAACQSL
jgi:hypothetical protein